MRSRRGSSARPVGHADPVGARSSYADEVEDAADVSTGSSSPDCSVSTRASIWMELRSVSRSSRSCWEVSGKDVAAITRRVPLMSRIHSRWWAVGALGPVVGTPPSPAWFLEEAVPSDSAFVLGVVGDGELDLLSVESVDGDVGRRGGVEGRHAGERCDEVIDGGTGGWVKLHPLAGIGEDVGHREEDPPAPGSPVPGSEFDLATYQPLFSQPSGRVNVRRASPAMVVSMVGSMVSASLRAALLSARSILFRVSRRGLVGGTRRTLPRSGSSR